MDPSDDELAQAYRENAENAQQVNDEWSDVSTEANQHLSENPFEEHEGEARERIETVSERSRNEDGIIEYQVATDIDDRNVFRLFEK
ncbi:hypothetical protein HAPAU_36590 [Halalkalicoccus paucihalophilus]|uniref:ABM domain-containing protein n=1 Tax=Halalkalicoccus paucihalophilus TaxID=1008153 RepID=A0A151A910_9EURY|nr:antibiotic biosynthesis monooxygenase [Halalkalicoccus paucihalophilus]KYH24188.1 hypothetical protein HAPAU_36590 [Halalkalicoccus paucihalophilus]